jgi:hypothetical protein
MGLFEELMKRVSGGPKDIQLPNESGKVDPRLPQSVGHTLAKTVKTFGQK